MSTPIQNAERKDFLCCVIVTAVEGGSNFWAAFRNYVHKENGNYLLTEASVEVKDSQGDYPADWKAVGTDDIEAALAKFAANEDLGVHASYVKQIVGASAINDGGDIDADLADMIFQVAVNGKVIFG